MITMSVGQIVEAMCAECIGAARDKQLLQDTGGQAASGTRIPAISEEQAASGTRLSATHDGSRYIAASGTRLSATHDGSRSIAARGTRLSENFRERDEYGTIISTTSGKSDARDGKVSRVVIDSRMVQQGDLFFAIRGQRFDGHDFVQSAIEKGATACVVDRTFAESNPDILELKVLLFVVDDTVDALGRLGAYYRREVMSADTKVIAVTGSNGKTTTKRMIDHVLCDSLTGRASEKSFNNQYGVPLTLLSCEADDKYLVVEIGTNARGEIAALSEMTSPDIAVITSIGEAHLEGLGDVDAIAKEKFSIIDYVRPGGMAFVNVDRNEMLSLLSKKSLHQQGAECATGPDVSGSASARAGKLLVAPNCGIESNIRVKTFGLLDKSDNQVRVVRLSLKQTVFELKHYGQIELPLPGLHHAINAAAAFCVAHHLSIDSEKIIQRLATFPAVDGRSRVVEVGGATLVDDTYNANPASVSAAVATLSQLKCIRRIFVLGDMFELGERSLELHKQVIQLMVDADIDVVVTVGEISFNAANHVKNQSRHTKILSFQKHQDASSALVKMLVEGDVVWLKGSRVMALERVVYKVSEQMKLNSKGIESEILVPFLKR